MAEAPTHPLDASALAEWLQTLAAAVHGESARLFALLYDELRGRAAGQLRKESSAHTLSATALTHEAWFRMAAQTRTRWERRAHFLSVASIMMRRILVNHAAGKQAEKRDGLLVSLALTEAQQVAGGAPADVLAVREALQAFERIDPGAARVVDLKFFGGPENDEAAQVLGISLATVKCDWLLARAWLFRELGGAAALA